MPAALDVTLDNEVASTLAAATSGTAPGDPNINPHTGKPHRNPRYPTPPPHGLGLLPPPKFVHSGTVRNLTNQSVHCTVHYCGHYIEDTQHLETVEGDLEAKVGKLHFYEKKFRHRPETTHDNRKRIYKLTVKRSDGITMELNEPFENIDRPKAVWEFWVKDKKILSIDPREDQDLKEEKQKA
ncbi:unnamed protein product [Didymodactylos carnosus]|uniref:Uncharacterized protein n=1 Tax=Didymodactylos carnosus TaxID=1234261 RepID=A0A814JHE8_9BILA|nr:unnamed protein product [Didymodactylos carnosus]CAF1038082.1 unnamed protein product [Didymodactylos carnosus]CAF3548550.1 unnamed protein product [Didymodactylos carnosus]CAF3808536.1 unnamed protein product [Didymodactylos carnosus]